MAGYKEEDCYFLYPNKAPKGWKNKLTSQVKKKNNKKDNYTRKKRKQQINLLVAVQAANTTSDYTTTSVEDSKSEAELEFEDVILEST